MSTFDSDPNDRCLAPMKTSGVPFLVIAIASYSRVLSLSQHNFRLLNRKDVELAFNRETRRVIFQNMHCIVGVSIILTLLGAYEFIHCEMKESG
jgi:hypothetical protein